MAKDEESPHIDPFEHAAGGWTSVREVGYALREAHVPFKGTRVLLKQNKPGGFACVSCSWAKPAHPHPAEFCEHGAKPTAWEITKARCTPAFFAEHTLTELEGWSDHDLEMAGRLTAPMPGKVVAYLVAKGDAIKTGQPLAVLEAMKMEHTLTAPARGTVRSFHYAPGDQVADGAELVEFEVA